MVVHLRLHRRLRLRPQDRWEEDYPFEEVAYVRNHGLPEYDQHLEMARVRPRRQKEDPRRRRLERARMGHALRNSARASQ